MEPADGAFPLPNRVAAAAGATALSLALLADTVAAERNPAAQVADRASAIRITGLRTYWVNPVVFVRIETNQGVVGWGDIKGVDPRPAQVGGLALRIAGRRKPDAHRIPLAEAIPGAPRHAQWSADGSHPGRHRYGPVGSHRQIVRRARLSAAGRAVPRAHPRLPYPQGARCRRRVSSSTPAIPPTSTALSAASRRRANKWARMAPSCSTPIAPAPGHVDPTGGGHSAL